MKMHGVEESGGVLIGALLVGLLMAMLGGVAMNLAVTETTASARHLEEKNGQLLAESGVEQVIAWLTHGDLLLPGGAPVPDRFAGTADHPDVELDAARSDDDRILNGIAAGEHRALADLGRIVRMRLYGPALPDGFCTVEVTAESRSGVRRTVVLELGALSVPLLTFAALAGPGPVDTTEAGPRPYPRVLAHWGNVHLAGDARLGRANEFPRKSEQAPVTGMGYGEPGSSNEDRWMEAWIGGTPHFDETQAIVPSNVHANRDPVPGLPRSPWHYQVFKEHARRFGAYYVPDREGRLYKDGTMDPSTALTPAEVFGSKAGGDQRGLVFVDTLDRQPPAETNLATLVLDSAYMEGIFYVNAHVILRPEGREETISALSPPTETAPTLISRVPVNLTGVTIRGVLHASGTLRVDGQPRVFGAVTAGGGLAGSGLLEIWYDYDLGRGLVRGLPVVFPLRGSWREW